MDLKFKTCAIINQKKLESDWLKNTSFSDPYFEFNHFHPLLGILLNKSSFTLFFLYAILRRVPWNQNMFELLALFMRIFHFFEFSCKQKLILKAILFKIL